MCAPALLVLLVFACLCLSLLVFACICLSLLVFACLWLSLLVFTRLSPCTLIRYMACQSIEYACWISSGSLDPMHTHTTHTHIRHTHRHIHTTTMFFLPISPCQRTRFCRCLSFSMNQTHTAWVLLVIFLLALLVVVSGNLYRNGGKRRHVRSSKCRARNRGKCVSKGGRCTCRACRKSQSTKHTRGTCANGVGTPPVVSPPPPTSTPPVVTMVRPIGLRCVLHVLRVVITHCMSCRERTCQALSHRCLARSSCT